MELWGVFSCLAAFSITDKVRRSLMFGAMLYFIKSFFWSVTLFLSPPRFQLRFYSFTAPFHSENELSTFLVIQIVSSVQISYWKLTHNNLYLKFFQFISFIWRELKATLVTEMTYLLEPHFLMQNFTCIFQIYRSSLESFQASHPVPSPSTRISNHWCLFWSAIAMLFKKCYQILQPRFLRLDRIRFFLKTNLVTSETFAPSFNLYLHCGFVPHPYADMWFVSLR